MWCKIFYYRIGLSFVDLFTMTDHMMITPAYLIGSNRNHWSHDTIASVWLQLISGKLPVCNMIIWTTKLIYASLYIFTDYLLQKLGRSPLINITMLKIVKKVEGIDKKLNGDTEEDTPKTGGEEKSINTMKSLNMLKQYIIYY